MTALNDTVYRDDAIALAETNHGMLHAGYWEAVIRKLLKTVGTNYTHLSSDYVKTGRKVGEIKDPVTGACYTVTITPNDPRKAQS